MAKKTNEQPQAPLPVQNMYYAPPPLTYSFRIMNNCNPVPVARPADFIQLTPVNQPMPYMQGESAPYYEDGDGSYDEY